MSKQPCRITRHNARAGNNGVFCADHNDRTFSAEEKTEQKDNVYFDFTAPDTATVQTFDQGERAFYTEHFSKHLDAQNEKYIKGRHPEKVKTIDEWRKSKNQCPEESLIYFGSVKDGHADPRTIIMAYLDFLEWHTKRFPQIKILNAALHVGEKRNGIEGAPHIHERRVYIGHDNDGCETVSQTKALEEMGIESPDPAAKKSRYNNPKMSYDKECRKKLIQIAKEYGLEIIEEPKEIAVSELVKQAKETGDKIDFSQRRTGRTQRQYIKDRITEEKERAKEEADKIIAEAKAEAERIKTETDRAIAQSEAIIEANIEKTDKIIELLAEAEQKLAETEAKTKANEEKMSNAQKILHRAISQNHSQNQTHTR